MHVKTGAMDKELGVGEWCIARTLQALGQTEEVPALERSGLTSVAEGGYVSEEIGECLLALRQKDKARPHVRRAAPLHGRRLDGGAAIGATGATGATAPVWIRVATVLPHAVTPWPAHM
jgi:hypothetical protein